MVDNWKNNKTIDGMNLYLIATLVKHHLINPSWCNGLSNMLQVTEWMQRAVGHETVPQVPQQGQAAGTGSREQPVPGRDSTVPQVAVVSHEEQRVR